MKLAALQKLYIAINGKPRGSVPSALQMVAEINKVLSEMHVIQEPPSLRDSVTRATFEKMSKIEEIQGKSSEGTYLKSVLLQKKIEIEGLKEVLENSKKAQSKDDVKDLIGG